MNTHHDNDMRSGEGRAGSQDGWGEGTGRTSDRSVMVSF